MPTYEDIYEDEQFEWVHDAPAPGRHRVRVTVLDQGTAFRNSEEIERILNEAHGAWQSGKTVTVRGDHDL